MHSPKGAIEAHELLVEGLPSEALSYLVENLTVLQRTASLEKAVGMSLRTFQRRKDAPTRPLSPEQSGRTWKFAEILAKASARSSARSKTPSCGSTIPPWASTGDGPLISWRRRRALNWWNSSWGSSNTASIRERTLFILTVAGAFATASAWRWTEIFAKAGRFRGESGWNGAFGALDGRWNSRGVLRRSMARSDPSAPASPAGSRRRIAPSDRPSCRAAHRAGAGGGPKWRLRRPGRRRRW